MAKEDRELYEVVNVTGFSNDAVFGDVVARFETIGQAQEHSQDLREQGWNTVVPPWSKPEQQITDDKFMMVSERSEEITAVAKDVQQQTTWDVSDRNDGLNWTVVQIEGTRDGKVYGEYVGNFDSHQEAMEAAEDKWNLVAVPWSYGEKQQVGSGFQFVTGRSEEIDKIAKTMDRGKEVTEDLVVCSWDGRNGPPIIGNYASFDAGREANAMARERMAKPIGRTGESIETEMYVMIRKGDGIEREGEIIQISDREETLDAWIEQCREAETYLSQSGFESASFGINREAFSKLDEVATQQDQQQKLEEEQKRQNQL